MEGLCRGCLHTFNEPTDLLPYCEANRRLFIYSTGIQVKRNDTLTFQLCKECNFNMKVSCKFKKQCRTSDKKFKNYITLKEDGDSMDFCKYLKNSEDTLMQRQPVVNKSSSPTPQRIDYDDNESTCTSMQNFMTDILQGEVVPPTEDQFIREVIQEDADILEESLDSHWLQEEHSIQSDFEMDFNFNAYSTPRSVDNDHCYTPRRLTDENEKNHYYITKQIIEKSDNDKKAQQNDMPILDDFGNKLSDVVDGNGMVLSDLETEYCIEGIREPNKQPMITTHPSDMPLLDDCIIEFDGVVDNNTVVSELETGYFDNSSSHVHVNNQIPIKEQSQDSDIFIQNKVKEYCEDDPFPKLETFKGNLFPVSNYLSPFVNSTKVSIKNEECSQGLTAQTPNENEFSVIINKGIAGNKTTNSPLTRELEYYINKVESKKKGNKKGSDNNRGKVLSNEKSIPMILNQNNVYQSPLTSELEKRINKTKLKIENDSDSNFIDQVLNKGDTSTMKIFQQTDKVISLNIKDENTGNVSDSYIKNEPDHYVKKTELKKNASILSDPNEASELVVDSIDRNLELALKNEDSQEFSLDQLLSSPQVSVRLGATTPNIKKKLFGGRTPKHKYADLSKLVELKEKHATTQKQQLKSSYYTEELIDDHKRQSPPDKIFEETESRNILVKGYKDINKLKELKPSEDTLHNRNELKDISPLEDLRLKDMILLEETVLSDLSENDKSDSIKSDSTNVEPNQTEPMDIDDKTYLGLENERLDISVTNLLTFDDRQSLDLNFSISSDFLNDAEKPDNSVHDDNDNYVDPFKMPFSPPDNKYDIDNCFCKICNKKYGSAKALRIHFMRKHKLKIAKAKKSVVYVPQVCQICGKVLRDKSNLNKHLKKHKEPVNVKCEFCNLIFITQGRLSLHMRAHAGEIARKENKDTENQDNNKKEKKFVCSTCGLASSTMANFKVHQRRHTKSYTVKCSICNKGFYRADDLRYHMGNHGIERNFACEQCPKTFKRRDLLMAHSYRHMNKLLFGCTFCNKSFISKQILKTHLNSKSCMANREKLAQMEQEAPNDGLVTVSNVVGSTEKIKEIIETKKLLEEKMDCTEDKSNAEYEDEIEDSVEYE